jgi:hypothetical protein
MPPENPPESPLIGTLNEAPLHAALKTWYAQPGAQFEVRVDGYVIDIVQGDLLVEIQTRGFGKMKRKLRALTRTHPVRLVYPVAQEKWIVKLPREAGERSTRRKSPKRGSFASLFGELISIPTLLHDPNFSIDVLLIQEEEVRRYDGNRNWRRKGWTTDRRRLLDVVDHRLITAPADLLAFLPADLPDPFTTADVSKKLGQPRRLAQQMCYCLRELDVITVSGKRGNAILYCINSPTDESV